MPALRAVVFDLDDTLYPERDFVLSGFRAVALWAEERLGIPADRGWTELRRLFEAGFRGDVFNRWLEGHGFQPDSLVPQMVQVYRGHHPHIAPYPEVPGVLRRLRGRYRLGLISDGYVEVQKRKLAALGLASCFDDLIFSDEWGREAWKPDPRPFVALLERWGLAGDQAVYVADNPLKDFLGARRVGMRTVRVRRADGLYRHLEPPSPDHAPDLEMENLEGLEAVLQEWAGRGGDEDPDVFARHHRG
jgi:putative hydrolase of the HAD superfamily